ncbi:MAG TPA: hypothetical protein VFS67_08580 [Polyangiaceae bacterium]|nr:hypothetical protein [Polyangiaceae bacterium]
MRKPSSTRPLPGLCALLALGAAYACGAAVDPLTGSETHFLARCTAECGSGLECLEGVCTRPCTSDGECAALSPTAACVPSHSAAGGASCRVACAGDADCRGENGDWSCSAASCVGVSGILSASGAARAARCPTFRGGVQKPVDVQTTAARVPGSSNVQSAYADESGVYWITFDNEVYGVKKGAASATLFAPAPVAPVTRLSLMADATRLYWTEAGAYLQQPVEPSPPPPPGRLIAVSKDGGAADVIVESPTLVLTPAGVDPSGRLFVTTSDGYLNEVTASGVLERVANVPQISGGGLQMVDGQVYWPQEEPGDDTSTTGLFVASAGAGAPVRLTSLDGSGVVPFVPGRGVVLWTSGETRFDPLLLVQHFVMLNENTGCVQELPSVEQSIGQALMDTRHVYWESFNALGSSSPGDPEDAAPLLRVDLRTGRFERVVAAGLDVTVRTDLVGQDSTTLYVRQSPDQSLFALRKPD